MLEFLKSQAFLKAVFIASVIASIVAAVVTVATREPFGIVVVAGSLLYAIAAALVHDRYYGTDELVEEWFKSKTFLGSVYFTSFIGAIVTISATFVTGDRFGAFAAAAFFLYGVGSAIAYKRLHGGETGGGPVA